MPKSNVINLPSKSLVFAVFDKADAGSLHFAEQLLALGIGDRKAARPIAVEWAAEKYGQKIISGQRGDTLAQGSAGLQAVQRVLSVCFPGADMPARGEEAAQSDAALAWAKAQRRLDQKFGELSIGDKRRARAALEKLSSK